MSGKGLEADDASGRLEFRGGNRWLLGFLVLGSLLVVADRYANYVWGLGPPVPVVEVHSGSVVLSLALLGLTVGVLRIEGVSLSRIGLEPGLLLPAVVTIAAYFLALNAAAVAIALASGAPETIGYQWTVPPAEAAFVFVYMAILAALVEEVVFRGYLQNRFAAAWRGDPRVRIAIGILLASALFSAYHVPRVLTDGPPGTMTASGYLLLLFVNGIGFGLLYEFTQNLYVPLLVHAAGNMPGTAGILFFTTSGWPTWAVASFAVAYVGLAVLVVLAYRRWAFDAGAMPVWTERGAGAKRGARRDVDGVRF